MDTSDSRGVKNFFQKFDFIFDFFIFISYKLYEFRAEKTAEELSLKRADLEKTKLKTNFSISQYFASDPHRHRQERIAVLEFEIGALEKTCNELNEDLVKMEEEISENIQVSKTLN